MMRQKLALASNLRPFAATLSGKTGADTFVLPRAMETTRLPTSNSVRI